MSRASLPRNLSRADAERIAAGFLARRRAMHGDATMTAPTGEQTTETTSSETKPDTTDTQTTETAKPETTEPKPLGITQADLDRIIGERVSAEQAKWQKKLDDAAALAGKNETEKLTIERDQAKARADEVTAKAAQRIAATEAKVAAIAAGANPQRVAAIVRNADLSGAITDGEVDDAKVKAAVEKVLGEYPEWKATATTTQSGGEMTGGGGGKPTFTRKQLEEMPPEEMAARIDEINDALKDGRVTG